MQKYKKNSNNCPKSSVIDCFDKKGQIIDSFNYNNITEKYF